MEQHRVMAQLGAGAVEAHGEPHGVAALAHAELRRAAVRAGAVVSERADQRAVRSAAVDAQRERETALELAHPALPAVRALRRQGDRRREWLAGAAGIARVLRAARRLEPEAVDAIRRFTPHAAERTEPAGHGERE